MEELDELLKQLESEDSTDRHEATWKLGGLEDAKAVETLVGLLKDPSPLIKDEAVNSLARIANEEVVKAVVPLLYSHEVYIRNISLEILSRLGEVCLPELSARLGEEDEDVLKFVIDIIGLIGNHEPVPKVIPLLKHKNPNIRAAVAVAFGKMYATEAIEPLLEALNDDDEWVKFSVLEALGTIGGAQVTEKLLDVFRAIDVSRIAAIDALSQLAEPKDCEKVMHVIASPGVSHVLSVDTVVRFIERFQGHMSEEDKNIFLDILAPRLHEADFFEQQDIIKGLGLLEDNSALDTLLLFAVTREYEDDMRMYLKDAIISCAKTDKIIEAIKEYPTKMLVFAEALGEIKDPDSVADMCEIYKASDDRTVNRCLVEAIGDIGDKESFDTLLEAVSDGDGTTRKFAVRGLAKMGDDHAVKPILDALADEPYDDVREAMGEAIASFSGDEVESALVSLLCNDKAELRLIGASGLSGYKSDAAKDALGKAFDDEDAKVRSAAVRSLATFTNDDVATTIAGALSDSEKEVRLAALDVLSSHPLGIKYVVQALSDDDMWVRFKAVNLLADKGATEAEEKLIELLKDDEVPVKISAARALGKLGSKDAVDTLKSFTDHEDSNLSEAATTALSECEG